ncbi:MAG: O-antigen ligase family protein [Lachnospiraceae bacterium]|nr:O-antigen ligase family protein [Lachnospiraceae bacterium]
MLEKICNNHTFRILFFYIPCIIQAVILNIPIISVFFNIWRIIAFILIGVYIWVKKVKITKTMIGCVCFSGLIILVTFFRGTDINNSISISMMMFTVISLSEIEIKRDANFYFKIIAIVSYIVVGIDNIQIYTGIGFKETYNGTLLMGDNFAIFSILPMLGIIVMENYINKKKVQKVTIVFVVITLLAKFKTFAVTSMLASVGLLFIILYLFYVEISKRTRNIVICVGIVLTLIVAFNFTEVFMLIAKPFGKDSVVEHSRVAIWENSIYAIKNHFLFGHGVLSASEEAIAIIGVPWLTYSHTHNYLLELLFRTGVVGTAMYVFMIKDCFNVILKKTYNEAICVLKAFLISFIILGLTDSYYAHAPIYVLVVLCSHIEVIKENVKLSVSKKIKL